MKHNSLLKLIVTYHNNYMESFLAQLASAVLVWQASPFTGDYIERQDLVSDEHIIIIIRTRVHLVLQ